jgi:hypothetical protein
LAPIFLFETERVEHSTQVKFFLRGVGRVGVFWNVPRKKEHHGIGFYFVLWGLGGQKTGFAYFKDLRRIEARISHLQQRKGKNGASWG